MAKLVGAHAHLKVRLRQSPTSDANADFMALVEHPKFLQKFDPAQHHVLARVIDADAVRGQPVGAELPRMTLITSEPSHDPVWAIMDFIPTSGNKRFRLRTGPTDAPVCQGL